MNNKQGGRPGAKDVLYLQLVLLLALTAGMSWAADPPAKKAETAAKKVPPKPILPQSAKAAVGKASGGEIKTNGFSYRIEPEPEWVVSPKPEPAPVLLGRSSMHYELVNEQIRVEASGASQYVHVIRVADESAGLGQAGQISTEFDPEYQVLVFHMLRVVRAGEVMTDSGADDDLPMSMPRGAE